MTSTLRSQRGFTYIAAMVMVMILGIVLSASAQFWSTRMKREREEELIFRGIQYRDAIRAWYGYAWDAKSKTVKLDPALRTRLGLPPNAPALMELEQLLQDPNSGGKVHYLRRLYPDPVASFEKGKEQKWAVVKDASLRIIGVKSTSETEPLKVGGFPDDPATGLSQADFEGKKKYSEWEFIFNRIPSPAGAGRQTGAGITNTPGGSGGSSQESAPAPGATPRSPGAP